MEFIEDNQELLELDNTTIQSFSMHTFNMLNDRPAIELNTGTTYTNLLYILLSKLNWTAINTYDKEMAMTLIIKTFDMANSLLELSSCLPHHEANKNTEKEDKNPVTLIRNILFLETSAKSKSIPMSHILDTKVMQKCIKHSLVVFG